MEGVEIDKGFKQGRVTVRTYAAFTKTQCSKEQELVQFWIHEDLKCASP